MEVVADQQILRGVAATLSWQNVDQNGVAAAPSGAVTVGVTRADGTELVAAGTATGGASSAPRTLALTAAQTALLDILTVTWTDAGDSSTHTTYVEVVGGFYFSLAEARASDAALQNADKYPDALIIATRREVEEEFERICGVSFVPRYRREVVSGPGRSTLLLERHPARTIRAVWTYSDADDYIAWTSDELATLVLDDWGLLTSRTGVAFGYGQRNLAVAYEHGMTRPPAEVKRAAMQRLRSRMNSANSGIPDRATQFSVAEGGTYRLDTAAADKTGMPEVDAVLARYSRRVPGVA